MEREKLQEAADNYNQNEHESGGGRHCYSGMMLARSNLVKLIRNKNSNSDDIDQGVHQSHFWCWYWWVLKSF